METPPREGTKALQSPVRRAEVGFTDVNVEQVLTWESVLSRQREHPEQRLRGALGDGWWLCVTGRGRQEQREMPSSRGLTRSCVLLPTHHGSRSCAPG